MTKNAHNPTVNRLSSSFRDPSGYVFKDNQTIKRVVLPIYFDQYKALQDSGFYKKVIQHGLLIPHVESKNNNNFIELVPKKIPFINYPYEWSFNQLKDAALHTLKLQRYAILNGFTLKDASAFNIVFHQGKPIFIDTLSFDFYTKDSPWKAFKMFVMHFLSPLALANYHGPSIFKLLQTHIDGLPLSLTTSLLPWKTRLNPILFSNIYLLHQAEKKFLKSRVKKIGQVNVKKASHLKHLDTLYNYINKLQFQQNTEWSDYYDEIHYKKSSLQFKIDIITKWIQNSKSKTVVDIGGNDGTIARAFAKMIDLVIVCDKDEIAVDANYLQIKKNKESNIIPLIMDVLQPTPSVGYDNNERFSVIERLIELKPDCTLALALVHHVALSGNVPFVKIADFFSKFSDNLIIEFPQKNDRMVQLLLSRKMDFQNHFDYYCEEEFEESFKSFYNINQKIKIPEANRVLYLMKKK